MANGVYESMSRWRYLILCLVFFLSGAAALVYEVSWTRQLGEILGHTSRSAGVILAGYFGGLAIGYELGGRWSSRIPPLMGYALAELIAAGWAIVVPRLFEVAGSTAAIRWFEGSSVATTSIWQAMMCLLILLPATVGLGATLPFMANAVSEGNGARTDRTSLAYGANTCGAMFGVAGSSSILLAQIGVQRTGIAAAGISMLCAVIAFLLSKPGPFARVSLLNAVVAAANGARSEIEAANSKAAVSTQTQWITYLAAVVSGFAVLALEVLYLRLFSLIFHNSSYSFGAVVAAFLLGLSLAAAIAAWVSRRRREFDLIGCLLLSGAVAVVISILLFQHMTQLKYFQSEGGFREYIAECLLLVLQVTIAPAVFIGMVLPALWNEVRPLNNSSARSIGRLTMANTLAAAAGSLVSSFWLLPHLGLWQAFVAVASLLSCAAVARMAAMRKWLAAGLGLGASIAVYVCLLSTSWLHSTGVQEGRRIVQRWESSYGWIDVVENPSTGVREVRQNIHYRYGSTGDDLTRERLQAHLPLLLHPHPSETLFLGLGTGTTAAGATLHPEVDRITVVELIPEVVEAARLLESANLGVVDHPRVTIAVDDARHFLLATERSFDVVVGDLFVPWESETGYLYSREHFERVSDRLKEGGLLCQWVALYQLGPDDFTMIADTFATVFPSSTVWWGHIDSNRPMVALVGFKGELNLEKAALSQRMEALSRVERYSDDRLDTPAHAFALSIGRWIIRDAARLNTVEHPRIEFLTPLSQQDDRLLKRRNLRRYFDDVLAGLPAVPTPSAADLSSSQESRFSLQRLILFGDSAPRSRD